MLSSGEFSDALIVYLFLKVAFSVGQRKGDLSGRVEVFSFILQSDLKFGAVGGYCRLVGA